MKLPQPASAGELSDLVHALLLGDASFMATGINEIHKVTPGDITFVDHPKYYDLCLQSEASIILIDKELPPPPGKVLLVCKEPFEAYNQLVSHFSPSSFQTVFHHPDAKVGSDTFIYPGVFIGSNVTIGNGCTIYPNVCIYPNTTIGDHVIIHAQAVIGADAFYYKKKDGHYAKMISCGQTIIEDHVEIGAACTIDRGVSSATKIGSGTKIDNHVHIGHDTTVGKNCLFAAQVGIAGVVTIEDHVTLWGQVGIPSKITIGAHAVVLGQSGITKSLKGNTTYFGSPADEAKKKMRELALIRKIPAIIEKLDQL